MSDSQKRGYVEYKCPLDGHQLTLAYGGARGSHAGRFVITRVSSNEKLTLTLEDALSELIALAVCHRGHVIQLLCWTDPESAILGGPRNLRGAPEPSRYEFQGQTTKTQWRTGGAAEFLMENRNAWIRFPFELLQLFMDDYSFHNS